MGYKIIGYVVWQGGKWYARRKVRGSERKLVIAGVASAAVVAGLAVLGARAGGDDDE